MRLWFISYLLIVVGINAGSANRPPPALPIAQLNVEATRGGEPVDVSLKEDGSIYIAGGTAMQGTFVARVVGSSIVTPGGELLASVETGGALRIHGDEKKMRLRPCSLLIGPGKALYDGDREITIAPGGDFMLKRPQRKVFSLPAGVTGDTKKACMTALLIYYLLPKLLDIGSKESKTSQ